MLASAFSGAAFGYVHDWVLSDDEKSVSENGKRILKQLPKVVFVYVRDKKGKTSGVEIAWH